MKNQKLVKVVQMLARCSLYGVLSCGYMAALNGDQPKSDRQYFNLYGVSNIPRVPERQNLFWPVNVGSYDICHWDSDRFAALTITIDDNVAPDHAWWAQMAITYDLELTWFVVTGGISGSNSFNGTWAGFQQLVNAGHSVQSHTRSHGNLSVDDAGFIVDYEDGQNDINTNITGQWAGTVAYPNGVSRVDLAKDFYIGGRGVTGTPNKGHQINYMETTSASGHIRADYIDSILYGTSGVSWLGGNRYTRGWLCTHFHSVSTADKVTKENDLKYIQGLRDKIWVATFYDVIRFVQQRDTATVQVLASNANRIEFYLSDWMDDEIYDHPLTLKFRISDDWDEVAATQDGSDIDSWMVQHEGKRFALIRAVPDRGKVILSNGDDVDPEPEPTAWEGIEAGENGYIYAGDHMGWIYVIEKPWVWIHNLQGWVHMPDFKTAEAGEWAFLSH